MKVEECKIATHVIPGEAPYSGVYVIDTAELFGALEGVSANKRGLDRMCRLLGLDNLVYMHNAGNDAHWTFQAFMAMMDGLNLDQQREARWPGQNKDSMGATSLTVQRSPWEELDTFDDMEGMFGASVGPPDVIDEDEV